MFLCNPWVPYLAHILHNWLNSCNVHQNQILRLRPALDNIIMVHSFLVVLEYTVSICFWHFRSSVTWMPNNFDLQTLSISSPSMVISDGKTGFLLKHIISSFVFEGFTYTLFSLVYFETSSNKEARGSNVHCSHSCSLSNMRYQAMAFG